MKAIMISIKPKWVAKILNGEKTIEVRKKFPKDYRGWVYIYCTKEEEIFYQIVNGKRHYISLKNRKNTHYLSNGKVVARFYCNNVDDYVYGRKWSWNFGAPMYGACNNYEYILKDTCLTDDELRNYVDDLCFNAIHISNLEIFNEPKELSEFSKIEVIDKCDVCPFENQEQNCCVSWKCRITHRLTKAPQNFCYVEELL